MTPLRILEHEGHFTLCLDCGTTAADEAVEEAGHTPNGSFWEGVTQLLLCEKANADLEGRFELDAEAGMFCAFGTDRAALERLGVALAALANDPARMSALIAKAEADGFAFDD